MTPTSTWTDPEATEEMVDERNVRPDLARALLINALLKSQGRLTLPALRGVAGSLSSRSLARTLREAALDGLVRIEGHSLYLTPLGQRVAKSM